MIHSIRNLGAYVRRALPDDPAALVEQLALASDDDEPTGDDERRRYLAIVDIVPSTRTLRTTLLEVSPSTLRRYLWLNLMKAEPGGERRDVTVRDLKYLVGPVFAGLGPGLLFGEPVDAIPGLRALERVLAPVLPVLHDFGPDGRKKQERVLLDLEGFRIEPRPPAVEVEGPLSLDGDGRLHVDWPALEGIDAGKRAEELASTLRKLLGWGRDVAYVTLAVEGRPLALEPAYRRFIYWYLVERAFENAADGHCHLCGEFAKVTRDFQRFRIKIYITDKTNFASGIVSEGFTRCYVLCQRCYLDVLIGDRLLEQQLETRLLRTPVYVIPEFAAGAEPDYDAVMRRLSEIRQEATELERLAHLRRAPDDLARAGRERASRYAYLTLLFHEKQNMAVKVREVIAEVRPSRVQQVIYEVNRLNEAAATQPWAAPFLDQRNGWLSGLGALLDTLPLRRVKGRPEVRPALTLARQLILGEPVSERGLIDQFLEGVRALVSQHAGYWIVPQRWSQQTASPQQVDAALRVFVCRSLGLRLLVSRLCRIERGAATVERDVPEPYRTAMRELELDAQQQALFLMGVLLGRVAYRQYDESDGGSKPVLEKLNYSGMSLPRVLAFATDLFDKMRQYRLLTERGAAENELLYSLASLLLTAERQRWRLCDQENVYYVLAGYAYETGRIIRSGIQRREAAQATASSTAP